MVTLDIMADTKETYSKHYYNKNRDRILAYQKEYYRKKKSNKKPTPIRIKHGKFILFGDKPPVINWDESDEEPSAEPESPAQCSGCS